MHSVVIPHFLIYISFPVPCAFLKITFVAFCQPFAYFVLVFLYFYSSSAYSVTLKLENDRDLSLRLRISHAVSVSVLYRYIYKLLMSILVCPFLLVSLQTPPFHQLSLPKETSFPHSAALPQSTFLRELLMQACQQLLHFFENHLEIGGSYRVPCFHK